MKKALILLILFSCLHNLSAQEVSVTPNPAFVEEDGLDLENQFLEIHNSTWMKNEGTEETEYAWIRTIESAPEEWEFPIADNNQHFFPEIDTVPYPVNLAAGDEGYLSVDLRPNGVAGCGTVRMDIALWSETGNHEVIYSTYYEFKVNNSGECLSSLNDNIVDNLSIHPNPSTDLFRINGIENISKVNEIAIFNIMGQQVKSFEPNAAEFSIGDLTNGLYLVSLISKEKGILRTIPLTKLSIR